MNWTLLFLLMTLIIPRPKVTELILFKMKSPRRYMVMKRAARTSWSSASFWKEISRPERCKSSWDLKESIWRWRSDTVLSTSVSSLSDKLGKLCLGTTAAAIYRSDENKNKSERSFESQKGVDELEAFNHFLNDNDEGSQLHKKILKRNRLWKLFNEEGEEERVSRPLSSYKNRKIKTESDFRSPIASFSERYLPRPPSPYLHCIESSKAFISISWPFRAFTWSAFSRIKSASSYLLL